jgi:hypothetical protein
MNICLNLDQGFAQYGNMVIPEISHYGTESNRLYYVGTGVGDSQVEAAEEGEPIDVRSIEYGRHRDQVNLGAVSQFSYFR